MKREVMALMFLADEEESANKEKPCLI